MEQLQALFEDARAQAGLCCYQGPGLLGSTLLKEQSGATGDEHVALLRLRVSGLVKGGAS